MIGQNLTYLLIFVICIHQIKGEWDCVDLAARRYNGFNDTACTKSLICQTCMHWVDINSTLYDTYNYTESDMNYCRWPDPDKSSAPWCYYEDDEGNVVKGFCIIDPCTVHAGCIDGNGYQYRDEASYTQSGHRCVPWKDLHQHGIDIGLFSDHGLEENFCRNPDNSSAPWCYYELDDMITKDFCQIDICTSTALSQFIRHTQTYINNLNNVFIKDPYMTEEMCAEKCLETTSFVCRSFEYRFVRPWDDKKCILSNESLFTTGMQNSPSFYLTIDLFTRKDKICDAYEDQSQLYPDECPLPLGLETGAILDSQLSASNSYDDQHQPANARLNNPTGWMANDTEPGHWLQVSFSKRMKITGILTQGGGDTYSWIEKFMIRYSLNGNNWWNLKLYEMTDGEYIDLQDQVFIANGEPNCYAKTFFDPPIWANHIRIYPLQWFKNISLRLEVIGCRDIVCNSALGLVNGQIKDSQIIASSTLDKAHNGPAARLKPYGRPGNGWIPSQNENQWIEVDLHETYTISAISTQGCEATSQWVTTYQLKFRADDSWMSYREATESIKKFLGNNDAKQMKVNVLAPNVIHTSQVRITPITWKAGVCLKLELIGCLYSACNRRLGMESGEIIDDQLSASSYYSYLRPSQGRLHLETWTGSPRNRLRSCWEPRVQETNQWLQVDLMELHTITSLITQGSGDDHDLSWLYLYTVSYLSRYEPGVWKDYRALDGSIKQFTSFADNNTPMQHFLDRPFITQKIRVSPQVWEGYGPCLRLEVVGCSLHETGEICGGTRVEYSGQCIGAVSSREPDACEIFSERSHRLKIDGDEMQTFLLNNFERIENDLYRYYRIGIETANDSLSTYLMWNDGTPLVYENWIEQPIVNSTDVCVLADRFLGFKWITYDCVHGNLIFATLCQFDLNECFGNQSLCETCVNVPGSYYCSCPSGYLLHEIGGNECEGICHHRYDGDFDDIQSNFTLLQLDGTCYTTDYVNVDEASGRQICNGSSGTLINKTDVQALFYLDIPTAWIATNYTSSCSVLKTEWNTSTIANVSCLDEYPVLCKQEISDVRCEDIFKKEDQFMELSTSSGTFSFFGYPPFYSAGTSCHFRIVCNKGNFIKFTFIWSSLRQNPETLQCIDKLIVTDRHSLLGVIERAVVCGEFEHLTAMSLTNQLDLKVEIDELTQDMPNSISFVITYEEIDGSTRDCNTERCTDVHKYYSNSSGVVTSQDFPSQLEPFSFSVFYIKISSGKSISFRFTDFRVIGNNERCGDFVSVIECDGSRELLGLSCGDNPPLLISKTSCLAVFYSTGLHSESYGFSAEYTEVDIPGCGFSGSCHHSQCNAPAAYIATPNYPHGYPDGARCSWLITTPAGTYIELKFVEFNIQGGNDCSTDYVKIFDGESVESGLLYTLCNAHPPTNKTLSSFNKAFLEFSSDLGVNGAGFLIEYHSHVFNEHSYLQTSNDTDVICPTGWDIFGKHCYRMFEEASELTWFQAHFACAVNDSFLVSIQTAQEMIYLHTQITTTWTANFSNTYDGIYTGLTDEENEGRFLWTDGSPLSYTDWSRKYGSEWKNSQPDGFTSENCGLIVIANVHSTNHWHDVPCARAHAKRYICKKPAILDGLFSNVMKPSMRTTTILEYMYEYENSCGRNQFMCDNGECILKTMVCDGYAQCIDRTDELYCSISANYSLSTDMVTTYNCHGNGENISISLVCDFIKDCMDGSDEDDCVHPQCSASEFECSNGQCIPMSSRCNLIEDCTDNSDELSCEICNKSFQCYDGTCHTMDDVCDGYKSCTGQYWEDEQSCDYHNEGFKCQENEIECNNGACMTREGRCIYELTVDGFQKGCRDATHLRYCDSFKCPNTTFKCPDSYCIPQLLRCNGKSDCPDGSDEFGCDAFTCPGSFRCPNSFCISQKHVCDQIKHCTSGEDELYCDVECPEGCSCVGYSLSCAGATWNNYKASKLPDKSRALNMSGISSTRERRDTAHQNGSGLYEILHADINKFTLLLNLDLSSIGLEVIYPGMFSKLHNLQILRLSNNKLKHLHNASFVGLYRLIDIDLSGNPISIIESGTFLDMPSITYLFLENMFITRLPENAFVGMKNLTYLSLRNSSLVRIASGAFNTLHKTTTLDISENEGLSEFGENIFGGLDGLETLISDDFLFCCLIGEISRCEPEADEFSSCDDLMRNHVLRVFMWLLGIGALVGNFFVIVWRCKQKERNKVQGSLILNLAISDFLIGTYMIIIASADMYFRDVYVLHAKEWKESYICHVAGFLSVVSSELSVLTLTTISVDRFICIKYPFSKFHLGPFSVKLIILFQWIFLLTLAGYPLVSETFAADFYGRSSVCLAIPLTSEKPDGWLYSVFIFIVLNLLCFFIILFCYSMIYFKFKQSSKMVASRTAKADAAEKKLAIKMALIISTDFFCWVPIVTMGILSLSGTVSIPATVYAWTAVFVLPLNSSLNPYIYTLSTIKFTRTKKSCSEVSRNTIRHTINEGDEYVPMKKTSEIQDRFTKMLFREIEQHHILPMISISSKRPYLLAQYMQSCDKHLNEDDINMFEDDLNTALSFVHQNGLVHGSLNEHSILVKAGTPRRAYLILSKDSKCEEIERDVTKLQDADKQHLAVLLTKLREPATSAI